MYFLYRVEGKKLQKQSKSKELSSLLCPKFDSIISVSHDKKRNLIFVTVERKKKPS